VLVLVLALVFGGVCVVSVVV